MEKYFLLITLFFFYSTTTSQVLDLKIGEPFKNEIKKLNGKNTANSKIKVAEIGSLAYDYVDAKITLMEVDKKLGVIFVEISDRSIENSGYAGNLGTLYDFILQNLSFKYGKKLEDSYGHCRFAFRNSRKNICYAKVDLSQSAVIITYTVANFL